MCVCVCAPLLRLVALQKTSHEKKRNLSVKETKKAMAAAVHMFDLFVDKLWPQIEGRTHTHTRAQMEEGMHPKIR